MPRWRAMMPATRELILLVVGALLAACSLVLDWDPANRPCSNGQCEDTYSCLGSVCIADGSVAEGQTCTQDVQCDQDAKLICTPRPSFACRKPCDAMFLASGNCGANAYCRPSPDLVTKVPRGSCVHSECSVDKDCDTGLVCIKIADRAGACLPHCQPSGARNATGTGYSDGCNAPVDQPTPYCQPLGLSGQERTVCLDQSAVTQADYGAACDFGKSTCARGSACINNKCVPYCDPTNDGFPCASADKCVTTTHDITMGEQTVTETYSLCSGP
jgi:hypothetical protein